MSGFNRVALSNLWLFGPLVQKQLEAGASTNAMLRTTTALTIVNAGNKENVLPGARRGDRQLPPAAGRHPRQRDGAREAGRGQRARSSWSVLPGATEPSKVAPTDSASYKLIERTVRELFPGTHRRAGPDDRRHRFAALRDVSRPHLQVLAGARQARGPAALPRHQRAHPDGQPGRADPLLPPACCSQGAQAPEPIHLRRSLP